MNTQTSVWVFMTRRNADILVSFVNTPTAMATSADYGDYDGRDLECPVCQEVFRTPKMLPCGHTLCLSPCLEQLAQSKTSLSCPECRTEHVVPLGGVSSFPTNVVINRMLKQSSTRPKAPMTLCPLCDGKELLLKCLHCTMLICEKCRIRHTETMQSDIANSLKETRDREIDEQLLLDENSAKKKLREIAGHFQKDIETATDKVIKAAQSRKETLLGQVRVFEETETKNIGKKIKDLSDAWIELKEFCRRSKDELSNLDPVTQSALSTMKDDYTRGIEEAESLKTNISDFPEMVLSVSVDQLVEDVGKFGSFHEVTATIPTEKQDENNQSPSTPNDTDLETSEVKQENPQILKTKTIPSIVDRDMADLNEVKICVGIEGDQPGQFDNPTCVCVCPATENIIVGDSGNEKIQIFDTTCKHVCSLSLKDDIKMDGTIDGLSSLDVAVSPTGTVVALADVMYWGTSGNYRNVNCYQMYQLDENSKCTRMKTINHGSSNADALVVTEKEIYAGCGSDGIMVHNHNGELLAKYATPNTFTFKICVDEFVVLNDGTTLIFYLSEGLKVAFNINKQPVSCEKSDKEIWKFETGKIKLVENKYLLVPNKVSHQIEVYNLDCKLLRCIGVPGQYAGNLYKPWCAALTKDGRLVVVSENNMLQIF